MDGREKNVLMDPSLELALLVRFKLKIYFAVVPNHNNNRGMERLSNFLHEEGTNYAKFPELASYFALPYINGQTAISHPLLDVIRKVYTKTLLVGINIF